MEEKPKRPWWKRKRWWAAVALWLVLPALYVAATGPVLYAEEFCWVPEGTYRVTFCPLHRSIEALGWRGKRFDDALWAYVDWWNTLAVERGAVRGAQVLDLPPASY